MNNELLKANIHLINDGIKFSCKSNDNPEIITDYYPPLGNNEGYKPLELFLISFGTCVSGTIIPLLRRFKKSIDKYFVDIVGIRRNEHPTSFEKIIISILIYSKDVEDTDLEKAIKMSEDKYCPIWSMIKNNVEVEIKYKIERR